MSTEVPPDLASLRQGVSEETTNLVAALLRRTAHSAGIGACKAANGATQIRDLGREAEVLEHVDTLHDGSVLTHERVRRVVQAAMDVSSETQAEATGLPIGDVVPTGATGCKPGQDPVEALEQDVDYLDNLIVALVAGRTAMAMAAANLRRERGTVLGNASRHGQVIDNYMSAVSPGSPMTGGDAIALGETVQGIARSSVRRGWQEPPAVASEQQPVLSDLATEAAALVQNGGLTQIAE